MTAYYGQEAKLEELCEWYDGYRFGSTEIYNLWFVIVAKQNHIGSY